MAHVRPIAFEHVPTGTWVCLRSSGLQMIRNGEILRRRWVRSLSRDRGSRVLCGAELYDLASPAFPSPVATLSDSGQLLPPGDRVLRWCPTDKLAHVDPRTKQRLTGLVCVELATGAGEVWWTPTEATPGLEGADLHLAEDGLTWALVAGLRMQIGHAHTPLLFHEDTETLERFSFDLSRSRVIVSFSRTRNGLIALPLRREVLLAWAQWADGPLTSPVASPLLPYGDQFLGVVRLPQVDDRAPSYEVWRFDETLNPRGRFEGFPRRRSLLDDQVLMQLADGSVAWMIDTGRVLIAPAAGQHPIETDLVHVVNPWLVSEEGAESALEAMKARDLSQPGAVEKLTPPERRQLAWNLLESLIDGPLDGNQLADFEHLAAYDPAAFSPHANNVLLQSEKRFARLASAVPRTYWHAANGASPTAVDELIRRIRARLPVDADERKLSKDTAHLVMTLAGVDTDYALEQSGPLAREFPSVEALLRQGCVDAPQEGGPAVRRFAHTRKSILIRKIEDGAAFEVNPALNVLGFRRPTLEELDKPALRPKDHLPQISLLTMDVSLMPDWGLAASRRPRHEFLYFGPRTPGAPPETWSRLEALSKHSFEVILQAEDAPVDPAYTRVGTLGGRPEWPREPAVPYCLHCGSTMYYVGRIHAAAMIEALADEYVYGFHCDYCTYIENVAVPA
jgi:hypothetical protein